MPYSENIISHIIISIKFTKVQYFKMFKKGSYIQTLDKHFFKLFSYFHSWMWPIHPNEI